MKFEYHEKKKTDNSSLSSIDNKISEIIKFLNNLSIEIREIKESISSLDKKTKKG